jgi:hypothetical protein
LNQRKLFGTLAGFVILAGISYHQVRDAGPDPRDTAIMSGTIVPGQNKVSGENKSDADVACAPSATGEKNCPDESR